MDGKGRGERGKAGKDGKREERGIFDGKEKPAYHEILDPPLKVSRPINAEMEQEAQLMLTAGSTRLAVSQGQQTWYHSTCYI